MSEVPATVARVLIRDGVNPTPDIFGTSRQVEVEITGDVDRLDDIAKLAESKVATLLGRATPPKPRAAPKPKDEQPATPAADPSGATPSPSPASATPAPPVSEEDPDDWEAAEGGEPEPEVTNADLTSACAKARERLGDPAKIKALIAAAVEAGTQPVVASIAAKDRARFLVDLASLKAD